ncbi:MAG: PSD1 domain-containing protein [Planctomycetaceae bacterium]|nr:PSD1 domain-containing protein [Planctomycetaceae bacterium]
MAIWREPRMARLLLNPGLLLAVFAILLHGSSQADDAAKSRHQEEQFERSIRPLLLAECQSCHGPGKQEGSLRVDSRAALLKGGDSGPALEPGQPGQSLLIAAVRRHGPEMPPQKPLSEKQIQALEEWIADGAFWPVGKTGEDAATLVTNHWAFRPVVVPQPPLPVVSGAREAIDAFIQRGLDSEGLGPAPEADRRTLIRRLSVALTGLPPTPLDVEEFVADPRPDAYERLTDRLLASPATGEHWARHWLDVARYSDTKGYVYAREERFLVQAAAYRDWVIAAIQQDVPYDEFVKLQLAADQLATSPNDVAAMGFLTIGRRFLGVTHDIIDDRIDVTTRGLMGLTVGCARCHDHKYDPIPTADYYSLYGVFRNCTEELVRLEERPEAVASNREAFEEELQKRLTALETKRQTSRQEATERVRSRVMDYLVAQCELEKYPEEGFDQVLATTDLIPTFVRRWDWYLRNFATQDHPVLAPWALYRALPAAEFSAKNAHVVEQLATIELAPAVREAFTTPCETLNEVATRYGTMLKQAHDQYRETHKDMTAAFKPTGTAVDTLLEILYGPESPCLVPDEAIVTTEYYFDSATVTELWKLQGEVDRWIIQNAASPPFAVKVIDREQILEPVIFSRGNPKNPGAAVSRHFLSVVDGEQPSAFESGSGRRELAERIAAADNPLTSRVWVNRVWGHLMGAGLVKTPSDFGIRAEPPSHPELLDYLAGQFVADGWSTRRLIRSIVESATFRQQSRYSDELAASFRADPENRLLGRMSPHRASFEELRDAMLMASDELDQKIGGKPRDLFAADQTRRSVYGLIDRQFVPSSLRVFDFANPDLHTPARSETTVPQQALFLMNHPFVARRAKVLAGRHAELNSPEERATRLFLDVHQRRPDDVELAGMLELVKAAEAEPAPVLPPETKAWSYGVAKLDPAAKTLGSFEPLPFFNGSAWQGSTSWPDVKFGWAQLTATGGHPGNTLEMAVVRRWTSPVAGSATVRSQVNHEPAPGDGIRCWVISSRHGVLKTWDMHQQELRCDLDNISVEPGDWIDFVVDIKEQLNSDQYLWAPEVTVQGGEQQSPGTWNAQRDFAGPPVTQLTPWEQLAQALLLSNEFFFVD